LLAAAHERILFADQLNLLDSSTASHVAAALDSGVVRIEREGVSETCQANFVLVGTYDPNEGEVASPLRDRVGLIVQGERSSDAEQRLEIIDVVDRLERDPLIIDQEHYSACTELRSRVEDARSQLASVAITKEDVSRLCQAAVELGISGNRADLFAVRAARASAALSGRRSVIEEDLGCAIRLVLAPRARKEQSLDEGLPAINDSMPGTTRGSQSDGDLAGDSGDLVVPAIESSLPEELVRMTAPLSRTISRGVRARSSARRKGDRQRMSHGRYVRSVAGPKSRRVAIDATLRVAAPFQRTRAAAGKDRVIVHAEDLRYKHLKHRSGVLFIVAVDASGSMAAGRMAQAKGALVKLLQTAYLNRDSVALVGFRGESAQVLLEPTRSMALARQVVDRLPAGGGTPLSAGLLAALGVAQRATSRSAQRTILLLFTDGRANVGLRADVSGDPARRAASIETEIRRLGAVLADKRVACAVVDTGSRFASRGEARALADVLGARYVTLSGPQTRGASDVIAAAAADLRRADD
jgi:magnesium chelatase subunit D